MENSLAYRRTPPIGDSSCTRSRRENTEPKAGLQMRPGCSRKLGGHAHANGRPVHRRCHGFEAVNDSYRELAAVAADLGSQYLLYNRQPLDGFALRVTIKYGPGAAQERPSPVAAKASMGPHPVAEA